MGDDFAPVLASRLRHRRRHQAKVFRLIVGADEEAVGDMIDLILMTARSRQKYFEFAERIIGIEVTILMGNRLCRHQQQVALGFGLEDEHAESLVVLLVDQLVGRRIGAKDMAPDLMLAQRGFVLFAVKQRAVVVAPGEIFRNVGDHVRQQRAGGQILDIGRVNPPSLGVRCITEQILRRTHRGAADGEKFMAVGQGIAVEHHLLGRIEGSRLAAVDRILFTRLEARVIKIVVAFVRHGQIGLLDPALDFFKKLFLKFLRMRHRLGGKGVLIIQIANDFGIVAFAQPIVIVHAPMAMGFELGGDLFDHRFNASVTTFPMKVES